MRPALMVLSAIPWKVMPSKMLKSTAWWCVSLETVRVPSPSQTTMSASHPSAMRPLCGYRLNSMAALVDVMRTKSEGDMSMPLTPLCQTTDMRSSIPLHPLGMARKSSLPRAFWLALNVALSVPTQSSSLYLSARISSSFVVGSSRNGGDMTWPAAWRQSGSNICLPSVPRAAAMGSPYTLQPARFARATSKAASLDITCTTYSGVLV
mmetsp:Transcript_6842/g.16264  ORF Transcript_6842/g.16264 Transcript_6842/m.16264 type:complete len:208 (-) Transcript_6842:812-1435(-)